MRGRKKQWLPPIKNTLEWKNGYWYENGKRLRKKDYCYCADCIDGESIVSWKTGQKYYVR